MGLQLGVVGRWARFTLYMATYLGVDLVVEVKNDKGDHCSHRITDQSPSHSSPGTSQALKVGAAM